MNDISPLAEVDADSLDRLFDRVNQKLISGLPESIDDEKDLQPMVDIYRARRLVFIAEQQKMPAPRARATKKAPATSVATPSAMSALGGEDDDAETKQQSTGLNAHVNAQSQASSIRIL